MTRPLLILGAAGGCLDLAEAVLAPGQPFELLGFLDDGRPTGDQTPLGLPVLGGLRDWSRFPGALVVNGIGSPTSFRNKESLLKRLDLPPERWATVVHPLASVSRLAEVGPGGALMAFVSLSAGVVLGPQVLMLPGCVVGHDSQVGPYCTLAAGAKVSGRVHIGAGCYLGVGAVVREGVTIGAGTLVGAGAVVVSDLPEGAVCYGNPARVHRFWL